MDSWENRPLSEIYDYRSGLSKPRAEFGFGHGFLTFKDVLDNSVVPETLGSLVNSTEKDRGACSVRRGDVFLTRTSETQEELGMSCVALADRPSATFNGFCKRLRPKSADTVVPEYAAYYFRSERFRRMVTAMSSLSTRASLNNSMLDALSILVPPRRVQRGIGKVLRAFDRKISLNRQTNITLEATSRAVFRSWFVDFDPVRAKLDGRRPQGMNDATAALFPNRFEHGLSGLTPRGWHWDSLKNLAEVNRDSIRKNSAPEMIRYLDISAVTEGVISGLRMLPFADAPSRARRVVAHGDTVWSSVRPNRRSFALIDSPAENSIASTGFAVLTPTRATRTYLYCFTTTADFTDMLVSRATGSAYPAVRADVFETAPILNPGRDVLEAFERTTGPMFDLIAANDRESRTLAELRDALLPKLLSGEVTVPAAEDLIDSPAEVPA